MNPNESCGVEHPLAVAVHDAGAAAERAAQAIDDQLEVEHVAGPHDAPEAHAVDAREERHPAEEIGMREHADGARLGERLDHQHAGHDRIAREVARAGTIRRRATVKRATHARARLELDDLVDQQERIAVRDELLDQLAAEWGL